MFIREALQGRSKVLHETDRVISEERFDVHGIRH
jgi:hypothetical protein